MMVFSAGVSEFYRQKTRVFRAYRFVSDKIASGHLPLAQRGIGVLNIRATTIATAA